MTTVRFVLLRIRLDNVCCAEMQSETQKTSFKRGEYARDKAEQGIYPD